MVYFPEEVFRNIASYMVDPYKAHREAHTKVWQMIRILRKVETEITVDEDDESLVHDRHSEAEYAVYTATNIPKYWNWKIILTDPDRFICEHTREWDNVQAGTVVYKTEEDFLECFEEVHNWAGQSS